MKLTFLGWYVVITLAAIVVSAAAMAGPSVVSDPTTQSVTHCGVLLDAAPRRIIAVTASTAGPYCKYVLPALSAGAHTIKMTYIRVDPLWGNKESPPSLPLELTVPAQPTTPPENLKFN